jgi:hypothetical protein
MDHSIRIDAANDRACNLPLTLGGGPESPEAQSTLTKRGSVLAKCYEVVGRANKLNNELDSTTIP